MTMMISDERPGSPVPLSGLQVDMDRARRRRNVVIALALAAFALLFFVITLIKFGGGHGAS